MHIQYPEGFTATGWHIGLKPDPSVFDFGVIHSLLPCTGVAVFTKNNLPGWPVIIGREHAAFSKIRTIIVNSGNANTATGISGLKLVQDCCQTVAQNLKILPKEVLPASTGIIGQSLDSHRDRMLEACCEISNKIKTPNFAAFSRAICTTDAFQKIRSLHTKDGICITGIAKGAGMIEPNMATMLAFICTDAQIEAPSAKLLLETVVNFSFNRITVDSDTSTSDTVALLANGASSQKVHFTSEMARKFTQLSYSSEIKKRNINNLLTKIGIDETSLNFIFNLLDVCISLSQMIIKDGEGSKKIIELEVKEARDSIQAVKIGKSVLNSPLFKTAIYGCDPNWGRIFMAIGKVFEEPIPQNTIQAYLGPHRLFPEGESSIGDMKTYLEKNDEVQMCIYLGQGEVSETLWGSDLNENYIRLNAKYTT